MKAKTPKESLAIATHHVLPNDTNVLDNLFGGALLSWMDITAAIAAQRHCHEPIVTAAVNHVSFDKPIKRGEIVTLEAKVSRAFNSSMEVFLDVFVENPLTGDKMKTNEAIYTMVAVDENGKAVPVPPIQPETELEQKRYDGALRRRQLSLILAGRMKPDDATELRSLFVPNSPTD